MTTDQIRQTWLDFFKSHDHLMLPSKSLIPINDPSLLWINSGVATLKKYFSGIENPPSQRLVNSQRAIRTNDIINVGVTARHHTFFEMLGSFSIGDYFKKEAIDMAYQLLTKHFDVDKDLLFITVYQDDEEAYKHWINNGIDKSHIIKGDRDRNFWDVGQGPCGPCTEIFYDRGSKYDFENIGIKLFHDDLENDRYVEIWNIVFSQFNNDGKGNYTELTRKNIDTGAGLERIASISQNVPTDFDTDSFMPIVNIIGTLTGKKYHTDAYFKKDLEHTSINHDYKVIADHIKACVFAIADGAMPSNKDRGSILRRLIRRAMVCARRLDIKTSFTAPVAISVVDVMQNYYPYLKNEIQRVTDVLASEEKLFNITLDHGFKLFEETVKTKKLDIETVFQMVDTYGFPFEIIVELARERRIEINEDEFNKRFEKHQTISRSNHEVKGMASQNDNLLNFTIPSTYEYFKTSLQNAEVIGCFDENFKPVNSFNGKGWIVFNKTVFYATSGGQIHDSGYAEFKHKRATIIDAIKGPNGQHFHLFDTNGGEITIGEKGNLYVDQEARLNSARNHSVEHLIQHALQTVIDSTIRQEGAFKSPEKVTFDYQYRSKLTTEQIIKVQDEVNKYIHQELPVDTKLLHLEDAKKEGAIAWFDDVYSKIKGKLRVVCMGNVSKEICGGNHVSNTKDIEQFMIVSVENKGGGAWRIEGLTSNNTINKYLNTQIGAIQLQINKMCKDIEQAKISSQEFDALIKETNYETSSKNLLKLHKHLNDVQVLWQQLMLVVNKQQSGNEIKTIKQLEKHLSSSKQLCYFTYSGENNKVINQALTELANADSEHAFVLINQTLNKIQYIAIASKDYVNKTSFNANTLIKDLNQLTKGSGGGRNEFAQGGTADTNAIEQIINYIKSK